MNNSNEKEQDFSRKNQITIVAVIFVVSLVLTYICSVYFFSDNKKDNITYNEKSSIKYNVCLKNNGFFNDKCLDSTKSYVSQLIDYINIDFTEVINSNKKLAEKYSYTLTSKVIATSKEDKTKVLYEKDDVIDKENFKSIIKNNKANTTTIKKNIKIDYDNYNSIINEFKKNYVLSLDSKLILTFNINYEGKYNENYDTLTISKPLIVEIPLSEQTIKISTKNQSDKTVKTITNDGINIINYVTIGCLLLLVIISGVVLVIIIVRMIPYKEEYYKKLDLILKEYDRAIVTTTKLPDLKDKNKIKVESFEELLDARENLEKPILFYQTKSGNRSVFVIINEQEVYEYVLTINYSERN